MWGDIDMYIPPRKTWGNKSFPDKEKHTCDTCDNPIPGMQPCTHCAMGKYW